MVNCNDKLSNVTLDNWDMIPTTFRKYCLPVPDQ